MAWPSQRKAACRNDLRGGCTYGTIFAIGAGLTEQPPESGQCERRAHQREEVAATERIGPHVGLLRKLPPHQLLKSLRPRQLVQRAPVLSPDVPCNVCSSRCEVGGEVFSDAHRWHTVQLVRFGLVCNVVLVHQLAAQFELIRRRLVLHVEDLRPRPNLALRMPMAVEAPFH